MKDATGRNRRRFLSQSTKGGLGLAFASSVLPRRVVGAEEKVGVGVIGSGGRGQFLMKIFHDLGAELKGVCDVYKPNLMAGLQLADPSARPCGDYRRLLDDKTVQAVIIATPDHWHARMTIDAVHAGKDVYVEKPLCHTVDEGFRVMEAVNSSKRIVQVGTQRRSYPIFQEGKKIMDSGKLGDVRLVTAWWLNHQSSLRQAPLQGDLDWKQWLGPAPQRPLDPLRFHNWYYFYDYSGGMLVGQGAHVVDAIHWFMNATYPEAVNCSAGRAHLPGAEIPETTVMNIEYPEDFLVTFTVGYKAMEYARNNDQLKQFHGDKARLDMARESYALYPKTRERVMKPELEKQEFGTFDGASRDHILNFLDCVRTRKTPNATVEMSHHTNVVLCMAIESLRKGCRVRWDSANRKIVI
jgi:predicted dehydrogenase